MAKSARICIIRGMRCAGCSSKVEKTISALPGAENVTVNYATGTMSHTSNPAELSDETIFAAIKKLGFSAESPPEDPAEEEKKEQHIWRIELRNFLIAALFTAILMVCSFSGNGSCSAGNIFLQGLLLIPVLAASRKIFISGIPALLRGSPDMDSLISCGAGIGILAPLIMFLIPAVKGVQHLSFDASAMILTLVMLGRLLEKRARNKVSGAIRELLKLAPPAAELITQEGSQEIAASALQSGQLIRVRPGDAIPADGIVISGSSSVNESMLSGEAIPIDKSPGSEVSGGTLNINGVLEIKVTASGKDSVLGKIIKLVSDAQGSKPPIAALADKVSGIFTWIILSAALLTAILWLFAGATVPSALNYALSVMVAACPCALGLATPIALIAGIGRGAKSGILIKNGTALENCARSRTIIFDKTGTLTSGIPEIKKVQFYSNAVTSEKELLTFAAAAEQNSSHPLAEAVMRSAPAGYREVEVADFSDRSGFGISCTLDGCRWYFGNEAMMREANIEYRIPENFAGLTLIFCAREKELAGIIGAGDSLKKESFTVVSKLKKAGFRCIMLTGDNCSSAEQCAAQCGIGEFYAALTPQGKVEKINLIRQETDTPVIMTGDGINDAPALAQADTGIAIGSGTAVALESADIILRGNDLSGCLGVIALSRATFRVIRQNLFWAFFYNFGAIPVAAGLTAVLFGFSLNPAICAGTMAASSLTVVLNALRLLGVKTDIHE